jgi:ADP-heptose:LPS heptosyltransferase
VTSRSRRWRPGDPPPSQVLLIQLRRIGDAVLITPVLDALREAWPDARLHLLTEPPASELFLGDDRVDVVWVRGSRSTVLGSLPDLRRERYDLVIDFQSLPATSLLARSTGGRTVGFQSRFRFYHHAVNLDHHAGTHYTADHKLDLVRALGVSPRAIYPRLSPPPAIDAAWNRFGGAPRVALVPVSPWAHKRWASEAFVDTARRMHAATGAAFVVAGGPGEGEQVEGVGSGLAGIPHETRLFTRVHGFTALLAGADLFLGNDNGPRHIALALGVPTLGYFRDVNPVFWTPPDPRHPVLWELASARGRSVPSGRTILPPRPDVAAEAAIQLLTLRKGGEHPTGAAFPARGQP